MTRKEQTGTRDLSFSGWIRENLPDSETGFMVSDIDFFLYNYKLNTICVVEVKTRCAKLKKWQKIFYKNLDKWLNVAIDNSKWDYRGVYIVRFENTCFKDGRCIINGNVVSEDEAKIILSMGQK